MSRIIDADNLIKIFEDECGDVVVTYPDYEESGFSLDLAKELINKSLTINAVVVPDCNECAYNGDISRWNFCEHCIGYTYTENRFLSKDSIKEGKE